MRYWVFLVCWWRCWCLQNPDISNSCPPGPSDFPMVRSRECVFMVGTHWTSAGKQADLNRLPFTLLLMRLWNGHTMGWKNVWNWKRISRFSGDGRRSGLKCRGWSLCMMNKKTKRFSPESGTCWLPNGKNLSLTKVYGASMHLWDLLWAMEMWDVSAIQLPIARPFVYRKSISWRMVGRIGRAGDRRPFR